MTVRFLCVLGLVAVGGVAQASSYDPFVRPASVWGVPCIRERGQWKECSAEPTEGSRESCENQWMREADELRGNATRLTEAEVAAIPSQCRSRAQEEWLATLRLVAHGIPDGQACPVRIDRSVCDEKGPSCRIYILEQRIMVLTLKPEAILRIPERCRTDFELDRLREVELDRRHRTREWGGPVYSAQVCWGQEQSALARTRIEEEKRHARELGIPFDRSTVQEWIDLYGTSDALIRTSRKVAALRQVPLVPCTNAEVRQLVECRFDADSPKPEMCRSARMRYFLDQYEEPKDTFPDVQGLRATQPLQVDSEPSEHEVWIDGDLAGTTPLRGVEVVAGTHVVEVRGDTLAWEPWRRTIIISAKTPPAPVRAALVPRMTKLSVATVPVGAAVKLDREPLGTTDLTTDVRGGLHLLNLSLKGYVPITRTIAVDPDAPKPFYFDFVKAGSGPGGRFVPNDLGLDILDPPELDLRPTTKVIRVRPHYWGTLLATSIAGGLLGGGGIGLLVGISNCQAYYTGPLDAGCMAGTVGVGALTLTGLLMLVDFLIPEESVAVPDEEAIAWNENARREYRRKKEEAQQHNEEVERAVRTANKAVEAALQENAVGALEAPP